MPHSWRPNGPEQLRQLIYRHCLLNQHQFLRLDKTSCTKPVEIHSARDIGCIEKDRICSCTLFPIHQRCNLFTEYVVHFQRYSTVHWYLIRDDCPWIEWIGKILVQCELRSHL